MTPASIDTDNGVISIGEYSIRKGYSFPQFQKTFAIGSNKIYGQLGDAKYCLTEPVLLFNQSFLVCLIFDNSELRLIEFILSDAPGLYSETPLSEDEKAKREFHHLDSLLRRKLGNDVLARRPYFNYWQFDWGTIDLVYQIQDLTVYLGITWRSV